jgi:uncharacterized YigZ family protein
MSQSAHPLIPAARARVELRVVNSRFIGSVAPAASVEEARAFIAELRAAMPDASHHVYAYVIGHGASTTLGMSDDGEPSGTAGRPVLAVLKGSGLGDVVLVVTRYFGGTLLGTGGLVHAYGDTARAALAEVPRAEKIARSTLLVRVPYATYEQARRLASAHQGVIESEEFAADVALLVVLPSAAEPQFRAALVDATAGGASIEPIAG